MSEMTEYQEHNDRIDYEAFKWLLEHMTPQHVMFKLIRSEMMKRGNWKNASRGSGFKKGYDPNRKPLTPVTEEQVEEVEERAEEVAKQMIETPRRLPIRRKNGSV